MGSVIGKGVSLIPSYSSQTSFGVGETSKIKYSSEIKQEEKQEDDYVTCLSQWTDEVTYKYIAVALTADLESNPRSKTGDHPDPSTAYMSDIRLEEEEEEEGGENEEKGEEESSIDKIELGTYSEANDYLPSPSTESDCSRVTEESEEEDKSCLELENKILQDYDQAKACRSLLSEGLATHPTSEINESQLVSNCEDFVPNPEDAAYTQFSSYTPKDLATLKPITETDFSISTNED